MKGPTLSKLEWQETIEGCCNFLGVQRTGYSPPTPSASGRRTKDREAWATGKKGRFERLEELVPRALSRMKLIMTTNEGERLELPSSTSPRHPRSEKR